LYEIQTKYSVCMYNIFIAYNNVLYEIQTKYSVCVCTLRCTVMRVDSDEGRQ